MDRCGALSAVGGMIGLLSLANVSALADEPSLSIRAVPPRAEAQPPLLETTPPSGLPGFHCDDSYCGFDSLRDLWKRRLPKIFGPEENNADMILLDRTRFAAEGKRWADAPPIFQVAIPGTDCALGGYTSSDSFGIRCGSAHLDRDPRFVCVDRALCTPTEEAVP